MPVRGVVEAPRAEVVGIRESVGLVEFPHRGIVHLAGPEGQEFLQGLVTSDVEKLEDGGGCRAAILTPGGRIFEMLEVFRAGPDALYLLLQDDGAGRLVEFLERYRFNEMVEVADLSGDFAWLSLQGPAAPAAAQSVAEPGEGGPETFRTTVLGERTLRIARIDEIGVPGLHFLIRRQGVAELREALGRAVDDLGGGAAGPEAWTVCRVLAGVPWMGAELDESVLPMDAGLQPILDLGKGCYIGQEVVSRGIVQGRANWGLWGLRLSPQSGVLPGAELAGAEKPRPVVRVRSVVRPPDSPDLMALAFVHREAARPGPLAVRGPSGELLEIALEPLPFQPALGPGAAAHGDGREEVSGAGASG